MRPDHVAGSPRLVVVGCGSIGRRHTANLRRLGVEDMQVYDPDPGRARALARDCGVKPCWQLEDGYAAGPDAVLVCAPTSFHIDLAVQAVQHGCHVFVEKPLSHSLEGLDELAGLAHDLRRVVMVGFNLRFNFCTQRVRSWLSQGLIGHVSSARLQVASYLPWWHRWEDYRQGYSARRELGGGALLDATHEIDYALWFFGDPERVYCVAGTFGNLEIDTEDTAELLLSYADRKVVSLHLDYLQRPPRRRCELVGDDGSIECDLVERRARLFDGSRREWQVFEDASDPNDEYLREMEHFLDCLAGRAEPVVDAAAGRRSVAVALAARRSAVLRQPVTLEPQPAAAASALPGGSFGMPDPDRAEAFT